MKAAMRESSTRRARRARRCRRPTSRKAHAQHQAQGELGRTARQRADQMRGFVERHARLAGEQRPVDHRQGGSGGLLGHVDDQAIRPVCKFRQPLRSVRGGLGEQRGEGGHGAREKRRRHQPPLGAPGVALGGEEPLADDRAQDPMDQARPAVVGGIIDEDVLDLIRVAHAVNDEIPRAELAIRNFEIALRHRAQGVAPRLGGHQLPEARAPFERLRRGGTEALRRYGEAVSGHRGSPWTAGTSAHCCTAQNDITALFL
jgi:hypothetical protein